MDSSEITHKILGILYRQEREGESKKAPHLIVCKVKQEGRKAIGGKVGNIFRSHCVFDFVPLTYNSIFEFYRAQDILSSKCIQSSKILLKGRIPYLHKIEHLT
jgi:hypothetical protein